MNTFWQRLPEQFYVLAPMADVTDVAYRRLIAQTHKPDVMWTEFVSADGIYHTREKKGMKDEENPLMRDLQFDRTLESPIVAQLFSSNPKNMTYAAKLCKELGYDGVDINMGCPDKSIEKQGCGSAMIKDPENARKIIQAARESGLPVSVKTRIGYNNIEIDTWIREILKEKPEALTVHLRTRKEMSKVSAHWDLMPQVVDLRDEISPETKIIGNGDLAHMSDAKEKLEVSGADGAMFGRAIFGNPWLFSGRDMAGITAYERLSALHTLAFYFNGIHPYKSFHILKKHIKAFVVGFEEAPQLRIALMDTNSYDELEPLLSSALNSKLEML
jgi:tRNA-dihydrouridine synthase